MEATSEWWSPNHCLKETSNVLGLFSDYVHLRTTQQEASSFPESLSSPQRHVHDVLEFIEGLGLAPSPCCQEVTQQPLSF